MGVRGAGQCEKDGGGGGWGWRGLRKGVEEGGEMRREKS